MLDLAVPCYSNLLTRASLTMLVCCLQLINKLRHTVDTNRRNYVKNNTEREALLNKLAQLQANQWRLHVNTQEQVSKLRARLELLRPQLLKFEAMLECNEKKLQVRDAAPLLHVLLPTSSTTHTCMQAEFLLPCIVVTLAYRCPAWTMAKGHGSIFSICFCTLPKTACGFVGCGDMHATCSMSTDHTHPPFILLPQRLTLRCTPSNSHRLMFAVPLCLLDCRRRKT